jgi:hypothetical protein
MNKKRALVVATELATNGLESGASLRVNTIYEVLLSSNFEVTVVSRTDASEVLDRNWDLIVLVSFSTARFLRLARKSTVCLWFDPTDSWKLTRYSLIRKGELKQIFALIRDYFYLLRAPKIDILTFISSRDALKEHRWVRKRNNPLILPIIGLDRHISSAKQSRFVFVGEGSYGPNKQALDYLDKVLKYLPENVEVHLFGNHLNSSNACFVVNGYVDSSDLYRRGDIHLAPIENGAGIKMKVAVPLWNGLRVIASPEAANGFSKSEGLEIAATPEEFASKMLEASNLGTIKSLGFPADEIYEVNQIPLLKRRLEAL